MKITIYSPNKQLNTKFKFFLLLFLSFGFFTSCDQDSGTPTSYTQQNEIGRSVSSLSLDTSNVTDAEFKVFDATGFQDKPDMKQFGIRPMHVMYTNHFWDTPRTDENRWEYPTESSISSALQRIDDSESHTVTVDIQSWPTNGDDETVKNSTMRYSSLYYDLKTIMPNTNFGYFNTLPVKNYWPSDPTQERLDIWRAKNDRLQKLGQKVDAFYLPAYTRSTDRNRWITNMKYLIDETRRIGDGQPIHLFLWPQYNAKDDESLDRTYIESDFWQLQLDFARQYADGIVFYAPHGTPWDGTTPWWDVTKQFMSDLGQYSAEPVVTDSEFKVYDGTRFRDKPEMTQYGFTPIKVIYQMMLWDKPMSEVGQWELPSKTLVSEWAESASKVNNELAIIDIEHWPTKGTDEEVQQSIQNYSTVYAWFKEAQPGMQFGYYDMVPVKNYWSYPTDERLQIWQSRNDKLKPLADKVDALFPQLYTFSQDQDAWVNSAKYYLKEAKRISGDKPVYAFLWPQYIGKDDSSIHGVYIDEGFWRTQLETARQYADGVVIWFPYKTEWQEASNGPWWEVTKEFLQNLGKTS